MRAKVVELPLIPGALTDDTDLAAKLHANDMDKVRYRGNRAETIKGWSAFNASGASTGTARGIHTYADLDGDPVVIAATESTIYAWKGGTRYDITPKWVDVWLNGNDGLDTTNTVATSGTTATITWNVYTPSANTSAQSDHYLAPGDSVTFSGVVEGAGGTTNLNGTYTIVSVPTPHSFTIAITGTGSSPAIPFVCTAAFKTGVVTGTGDTAATRPRVYSIDNFGENAVFCGSEGTPVFYWQSETSNSELLSDTTFAGTGAWTEGTGWQIVGGVAKHSGTAVGSLTQDVSGVLESGKTYEMSFSITATPASGLNTFTVLIDSVNIFPAVTTGLSNNASAVRTYTYRFVCPASPTNLKITADGASGVNVTIDNASVKKLIIARNITEAPQKNYALFVDGNHILNVLGSVEADGDFNANLLRWSDQDNYRTWVPSSTNVAGEFSLGKGSKAVCGGQVGERNLILTDDAAYTASFTNNGYSVRLVGQGCGAVGQRALAIHNNRAFWPSLNGFYAYDGAQVLAIECPVKDRYVGQLKQYQENKTYAWINNEYGEVWFHYPHTSDGNEISRYLIFNFIEQGNPWSFGTFNRTCWTRSGVYKNPIAIDSSGNIWSHETGTSMSGSITLPYIETGYVTGEAGDRWLGCRRYYPDFESQTGDILFTVTGKRAPQGQNNTQIVGPLLLPLNKRSVDFLLAARQLKFKWASYSSTTQWRLGIVGLEMLADKERR